MFGCHHHQIRKASADQVYLVILQNENLLARNIMEDVLEILTETCWESDLDKAKERMFQIFTMAGLDFESITKQPKQAKPIPKDRICSNNDENSSYSSLVGFSGF